MHCYTYIHRFFTIFAMKLFAIFGLLIFCFFQVANAKEDKSVLLAKIENIRSEVQVIINNLKSLKRNFLVDLKYQLSFAKIESLQRIDRTIKQILYRIKRAAKTGYVVDCYQSYISSIENSNLPAKTILNKCWQINKESIYGSLYEADEIEIRAANSNIAEKCYEEAELSIERLFLTTRLDLTKCSNECLKSALNLTFQAEGLLNGTGKMVIDRLNIIQEESRSADDNEIKNYISHRIYNVDPYVKRLKQSADNLLGQRKPIESQAVIDVNTCNERPLTDMYETMSEIERTANTCIRSSYAILNT